MLIFGAALTYRLPREPARHPGGLRGSEQSPPPFLIISERGGTRRRKQEERVLPSEDAGAASCGVRERTGAQRGQPECADDEVHSCPVSCQAHHEHLPLSPGG